MLSRVTVQGRVHEGPSPTHAWAGVFEGPGKPRSFSGARLFGLSVPQVVAALQRLPGAAHCSRYTGWQGARPAAPELVRALSPATMNAEAVAPLASAATRAGQAACSTAGVTCLLAAAALSSR